MKNVHHDLCQRTLEERYRLVNLTKEDMYRAVALQHRVAGRFATAHPGAHTHYYVYVLLDPGRSGGYA